jgi:gamma-glutamyltranspeptidase / glutathione hydrolase
LKDQARYYEAWPDLKLFFEGTVMPQNTNQRIGLLGGLALLLALLAGCQTQTTQSEPPLPAAPEGPSGFTAKGAVVGQRWMVATANPLASQAAAQVLRNGGKAIDAAVAAQMMLTLVEPQSSGIGGGAFMLYYDAATRTTIAMDGRETAPSAASETLFLDANKQPLAFHAAVVGGRSVGVPGVVAALEELHKRFGNQRWANLLSPAIETAEKGFAVSPRLNTLLAAERFLKLDPPAAQLYYNAQGQAHPVGHSLKNPELAASLKLIAAQGQRALQTGPLAQAIVDKVNAHAGNPGVLQLRDLASYRPKQRDVLCGPYLRYVICGMPPPSSGTVAVLQMLDMLQQLNVARGPAPLTDAQGQLQALGVHRFSEAGRLAFADRNLYIADPDFVPWPKAVLSAQYNRERAGLISDDRSMGRAQAGKPPAAQASLTPGAGYEETGTSHISIVDAQGNAVSMTTTIEDAFGARQMVGGFLLNNQLTDFSFAPTDATGQIANRVQAGKRPRSSMAPILVFDRRPDGSPGELRMSMGSPGGSLIINYVAKTLVASLADGVDIQTAISLPNIGSRNGPTELEKDRVPASLDSSLTTRGHELRRIDMTSGLQGIMRHCEGQRCYWVGGADPRREGLVIGQ